MNPSARQATVFSTNGVEGQLGSPDVGLRPERERKSTTSELYFRTKWSVGPYFFSMSLIQAENTLAFMSAEPAASKMLLGCQSRDRTVDRRGFLIRLATHQLFSSSKEQTAMAL